MEHEEDEKREEMFEPTTRILLALRCDEGGASAAGSQGNGEKERVLDVREDLLGFCSFRFDVEETADDDRMAEVIYW